jgi:hypothetical protein
MGMHTFHCGGQSYKQRLTPCEAREVLALPTYHSVSSVSSMVGKPLAPFAFVPRHRQAALSFSVTCRQRASRHWRRSTHFQTQQARAAGHQHRYQRQHHHDACAQAVFSSERPRSNINHPTPTLVRLGTGFHVSSCGHIPGRTRCEQPGNTSQYDPTSISILTYPACSEPKPISIRSQLEVLLLSLSGLRPTFQ